MRYLYRTRWSARPNLFGILLAAVTLVLFVVCAEGSDGTRGSRLRARYHQATPGYFEALGIRLLAGRTVRADDIDGKNLRLVINESLARQAWPGMPLAETINRRLTWSSEPEDDDWFTVVGVVADVKDGPTETATLPSVFFPYDQQPWPRKMFVAVRASGDPAAQTGAIRETLRAIDSDLPLAEVVNLRQLADGPLAEPRFTSILVSAFAAVTLGFALVGLASVIAYTAGQRRREVAVRVALGATAVGIVRLFLRQGLAALVAGVGIGTVGAAFGARYLRSLLFGVEPSDPGTLVAVALTLLSVGLLAAIIPAMRAARVEPNRLLGSE